MVSLSSICTPTSPFVRYANLVLQLFAVVVYAFNPPNNAPALVRLRFYSFLILALSTAIFLFQNNSNNLEFPNALVIALVGILQSLRTRNATQEVSSGGDTKEKAVQVHEISMREISLSLTSSEMNDFFVKLKMHLRDLRKASHGIEPSPLGAKGITLKSKLSSTQLEVRRALTHKFDTQEALRELRALMKAANEYMLSEEARSLHLLECVGRYIAGVFGFTPTVHIEYTAEDPPGEENVAHVDGRCTAKGPPREEGVGPGGVACEAKGPSREESVAPVLDVFVAFRDEIRAVARNGGENSSRKLLKICERVRDDSLPPLGIRLEEVYSEHGAQTRWKLENAESILKDIERRKEDEKRRKEKTGILEEKRIRRESNDLISGGNTVEHLFNGNDLPAFPPLIAKEPDDVMLD